MSFLNWLGRLIVSCCAIAAAWGAWYVVYQGSLAAIDEKEPPRPQQTLAVEVITARKGQIEERIVLVGNLLPISQTEVRSRVDGYILSLPFDIGDRVSIDDTLCQLDDAGQQEALEQTKATLDAAKAQLGVQKSELNLAEKNFAREETLSLTGAGTEQQLETSKANLEIAKSKVQLELAHVAEAQANVSALEVVLKDFQLKAPISGFVANRTADIGDLAKPDAPLMQIVDLEKVRTTVHIIEKDYRKVAVGQKATVTVDAYPQQTFHGKVTRIAPVLDQETRTASVQIEIENSKLLLKPGMYARVSLNSEQSKSAVLVPLAAIVEINDRPYVYLVGSNTLTEMRQVRLGTTDGRIVEIVEGIAADEQVITLGNRLIQPGQEVIVREVSWSPDLFLSKETGKNRNSVPVGGD